MRSSKSRMQLLAATSAIGLLIGTAGASAFPLVNDRGFAGGFTAQPAVMAGGAPPIILAPHVYHNVCIMSTNAYINTLLSSSVFPACGMLTYPGGLIRSGWEH